MYEQVQFAKKNKNKTNFISKYVHPIYGYERI